mmetsp:Transcript_4010/g.7034  ORF Transcript_4010/g.7034 Transcript_4010/m.7034 type:complete len:165 (-) Transcript_4010:233-727(-)
MEGGVGVTVLEERSNVLLEHGLVDTLNSLRSKRLRSTFIQYLPDIEAPHYAPIKPRCPAGRLGDCVFGFDAEEVPGVLDRKEIEAYVGNLDEKEFGKCTQLPVWLDEEVSWMDEKRRRRKHKKRRRKRRAARDDEDDELRSKKKRKKGDTEIGEDDDDEVIEIG